MLETVWHIRVPAAEHRHLDNTLWLLRSFFSELNRQVQIRSQKSSYILQLYEASCLQHLISVSWRINKSFANREHIDTLSQFFFELFLRNHQDRELCTFVSYTPNSIVTDGVVNSFMSFVRARCTTSSGALQQPVTTYSLRFIYMLLCPVKAYELETWSRIVKFIYELENPHLVFALWPDPNTPECKPGAVPDFFVNVWCELLKKMTLFDFEKLQKVFIFISTSYIHIDIY